MSNLENIQRKISEGVSGWLLYEFNCFRGYLFNEKYLSYPVGQILNGITKFKTEVEINHPCGNIGKGRPLQIDFVLSDKNNNLEWKYAFESKWIGNNTITLGSMLWDLIRLQNLFKYHSEIECYFILSGFDKKINDFLGNIDICYNKNSQKKSDITNVNGTFLEFNLFKLDENTKKYLNDKIAKYPNMSLYSKIKCRPAHRFPKKDIINMTFTTYVFEILTYDKTHKVSTI